MASAGLVIGILIIPLVSSMSEDALSAVPRSLREASYGLGATKFETPMKVVLPAAISGLSAAFIVAISRAVGETMVVAIAAGAGPRNYDNWGDAVSGLKFLNPFKAAETMTGHIVRISGGDLSYDSIDYDSIFAIRSAALRDHDGAQPGQPLGRQALSGRSTRDVGRSERSGG